MQSFEAGTRSRNAAAGLLFERHLVDAITDAFDWRYVSEPDHFNLSLPIASRTGTLYEFDGAFDSGGTLYVLEAKRFSGSLTREHVGIFVLKLIDLLLGAYEDIGHLTIKPVIVSGSSGVDLAAWKYAISWGVALVSPQRITPFEIAASLQQRQPISPVASALLWECQALGTQIWRPLNMLVAPDHNDRNIFRISADTIYGTERAAQLWEQWGEIIDEFHKIGVSSDSDTPPRSL